MAFQEEHRRESFQDHSAHATMDLIMAAEPATSAIFRALRSVDVDPDLAYEAAEESRRGKPPRKAAEESRRGKPPRKAAEESRRQAGENVIAAIGAQITEMRAEMGSQITEMRAEFKAENAEIRSEVKAQGARVDALGSHIDALGSRIDTLQKVIWPLMAILATSVFGLLYKAVTG